MELSKMLLDAFPLLAVPHYHVWITNSSIWSFEPLTKEQALAKVNEAVSEFGRRRLVKVDDFYYFARAKHAGFAIHGYLCEDEPCLWSRIIDRLTDIQAMHLAASPRK